MKLLQLLRVLDADDHKNLERFLESPYFKVSDRFLQFYLRLKKKHPDFDPDKPALKSVYEHCFGKNTYADAKLYNLMSDLARQLERFLAVEEALGPENKPATHLEKHLLISALGKRNTGAYFREEAEGFTQKLDNLAAKGPEEWYFLYKAYEQIYFNPDTPKSKANVPFLHNALDGLVMNALTTYLRYAAEWESRNLTISQKGPPPYLNIVLELTSEPEIMNQSPLLEVYRGIVLTLQGDFDEEAFSYLVTLFTAHQEVLPQEDRKTILRQLINFGIRLWDEGTPMMTVLLDLYKSAISLNILLDNGRMPHISFYNVVSLGAKEKEFDFVEQFIELNSPLLEETLREPVVRLARAILFYNMENLDAAHEQLNPDVYRIQGAELAVKILLIKITFDRFLLFDKDESFLSSLLDALEQYVKSKDLPDHKKLAMLHFTKMIRAMVKSKKIANRDADSEREKLKLKLRSLKPVHNKNWLEERIF
ncbi:MAG: hypothetical protein JNN28_08475 [Saprospiraceae bacterium]|nr:hypothetical protein [Saprospiraceae bacterium]